MEKSKFVVVKCDFCQKSVEKPVRFLKYSTKFCNRQCFAEFKKATPKPCKEDGCVSLRAAKGLCQTHYDRLPERKIRPVEQRQKRSKTIQERRATDPEFASHQNEIKRNSRLAVKDENPSLYYKKQKIDREKPSRRFGQARAQAAIRGVNWTLTWEEYYEFVKPGTVCHYGCGSDVPKSGSGLDRIDNNKGYEPGNVLPCCSFCNLTKGMFLNGDEMIEVVKLLKTLRKTDKVWNKTKSRHDLINERKESKKSK